MGKASRWWKGFLGMKKDRETIADASLASSGSFKSEKKRWSFSSVKLSRDLDSAGTDKAPARVSASDVFWGLDDEKEQSKQAMAVLAATAAAADAAVAAAEVAVAAVKLSGKRRGAVVGKEARSAVKIQSVFRGFLSRKALRALKGLVKIQALVRGYLVRKQTATALHRIQTLIRAQESIRLERARRSVDKENSIISWKIRRPVFRKETTPPPTSLFQPYCQVPRYMLTTKSFKAKRVSLTQMDDKSYNRMNKSCSHLEQVWGQGIGYGIV